MTQATRSCIDIRQCYWLSELSECCTCTQDPTHLIYNVFVVSDVLAEVHGWRPDVVLVVQTAAGLFQVLLLGDGNLIPGGKDARHNKDKISSLKTNSHLRLANQNFLMYQSIRVSNLTNCLFAV